MGFEDDAAAGDTGASDTGAADTGLRDSGMDSALDAAPDTGIDATMDSGPPADAGTDAAPDAIIDAGSGLVDRSVLVRYFLDEGSIAGLVSSSEAPLDLAFLPAVTTIAPATETTGAGFAYSVLSGDDRLCGPIAGTAIEDLIGGTTGTIEAVADLVEGDPSSSRIAAVGQLATNNWGFSMGFRSTGRRLIFSMSDTTDILGDWPAMPTGRHVFTITVDVTNPVAEERLKLYIDGAEGPANIGLGLSGTEAVAIALDSLLCIGNRAAAGRGLVGRVYYAAYYAAPLTPAEVGANAARLLANDD